MWFFLLVSSCLCSAELLQFPGDFQHGLAWIQPRKLMGGCGVAVTTSSVFLFGGSGANISFTSGVEIDAFIASVGRNPTAVAAFDNPQNEKGIYLAVADSKGGISFSFLGDCTSVWQLVPEWSLQFNTSSFVLAAKAAGPNVMFISTSLVATVWMRWFVFVFFIS